MMAAMDIDWIRQGLARSGKTQRGLARALNVDPSAVSRLLDGKRQLKAAEVPKVAAYLGIPAPTQHGPVPLAPDGFPPGGTGRIVEFAAREYAVVPVFDLRLSAGPGAYADDRPEPLHFQVYEHQWLRSVTPAPVEDLMVGLVSGDSMEETLHHGDHVLLDLSKRAVGADGLYGFRSEDELQVKRFARNPVTGKLTISSDNPRYPTWNDVAPDSIRIIGRVVWLGRQV